MRLRNCGVATLALCMLNACSTPAPAPQLLQHDLGAPFAIAATPSPVPLRSVQVQARPLLAGTAMLYREAVQPTRRGVYAHNRWAASPASLVEAALTRSMGSQGAGRCRLLVTLSEFIIEVGSDGRSQAVLAADSSLWRDAQAVLAQKSFDVRVPMGTPGPAAGALALREAVLQLGREQAVWLGGDAAHVCRGL